MAWNPTYKVNLLDVLDKAFTSDQLKDALRPTVAESGFKALYGQRVVDEIVVRTREENIDKKGRSLGTYSTTYKDSLVFQIYKGGQRRVDLTLTGEMLESLRAKSSRYDITVFLDGDENKAKAQGHISGIYGTKGRSKPRDFLGLPTKEEVRLFKEAMKDYRNMSALTLAELSLG
jgi:hypothetical protein